MSTLTPTLRRRGNADEQNGKEAKQKPAKDPRVSALWRFAISITVFTTLGALFLGFEDPYAQPLVSLGVVYTLELSLERLEAWAAHRPPRYAGGFKPFVHFMLPAHITALSIALLLYPGSRLSPIVFAGVVAVCSKFILCFCIQGRKKHFMNPSNLGIAATLLLFPSVGIAPAYQFTENTAHNPIAWLLPAFVIMAGTMLNMKLTRKWPLILGWLGAFVAQAFARAAIFGTPVLAPLLPLTGLVFWLYTNYMITDPGTTPFKPRNQVIFGASVGIIYGILVSLHVAFGLFFALVIVCALRGVVLAAPGWRAALRWRLRESTATVAKAPQRAVS
jgi:hypothetical protein